MATFPQATIPAFPAGYTPVPAVMNGWIQQPLQFLTQRPIFRGIQQLPAGQALSSATFDALQVGGTAGDILEDPYAGWSNVATAGQAAWSWLVPYTGLYEVTVAVPVTGASTIWLNAAVAVSGAAAQWMDSQQIIGGIPGGCCGVLYVAAVGGIDYIQAGTAVSGSTTTDTTAAKVYPSLSISYVSGE